VPSGWVSARTLHPKSSPTGRVTSLGEAFSITLGISMCTIPDLGFLDSHSRLCAQTCDDFVNEMSEMGGQGWESIHRGRGTKREIVFSSESLRSGGNTHDWTC